MTHDVEHVAIVLVVAKRHHLIGRNPQGATVVGKRGTLARTKPDKVRPFGSRCHDIDSIAKVALEILQCRRLVVLGRLKCNLNDILVNVFGAVNHRHIAVDLIAQVVGKRIVAAHGVEVSLARQGHIGMGIRNHGIRDIHGQIALHGALDHGTTLTHDQGTVLAHIAQLIGHRRKQIAQARVLTTTRRHKHNAATMQLANELKRLGTRLTLPWMQQRAVQIAGDQLDSLKTHMLPPKHLINSETDFEWQSLKVRPMFRCLLTRRLYDRKVRSHAHDNIGRTRCKASTRIELARNDRDSSPLDAAKHAA